MLGVILDEPQVLDSLRYIRELAQAEKAHNLDNDGVVEKLTDAINACNVAAQRNADRSEDYLLAKARYLAEIRERVALPKNGIGIGVRGGFRAWCIANKADNSTAHALAKIGASRNPDRALAAYRVAKNKKGMAWRRRVRDAAGVGGEDAMSAAKRAWHRMAPVERAAFVSWVMQQINFDKQAAD